jgi:IS30 family transposase
VNAQTFFLKRSRIARSVTKISEEKIGLIDSLASPLIKNGQSIHSAYISQNELKSLCSESILRRLCYGRYLAVKPIDLRRYVRYKREYKKTVDEMQYRDVKILANRTYKDYLGYIMKHKTENIVQYDSVIGKIFDEKALLTITFPKYNFQFARIIRKGSADSVNTQIRKIFKKLDNRLIKSIFPINLCDNGSEFSHFNQIEFDQNGEQIIKTFFTTPYRATNKSECERNHELVRYILPKGRSLNNLTQDAVNEVFSNIDSYPRKSKGGKTPYDLVRRKFGVSFLDAIGIRRIEKKKVRLVQII